MLEVHIALKGGAVVVCDASRFIVRTHRASGRIMGYEWKVNKDDEMEKQLLYLDVDEIAAVVAIPRTDRTSEEEIHVGPDGGEALHDETGVREDVGP